MLNDFGYEKNLNKERKSETTEEKRKIYNLLGRHGWFSFPRYLNRWKCGTKF